MTGISNPTIWVDYSNIRTIDSLVNGQKWADSTIEYSLSTAASNYQKWYGNQLFYSSEPAGLQEPQADVRIAARAAMEGTSAANKGFSIEGFTLINIEMEKPSSKLSLAHIRIGVSDSIEYDFGPAPAGYAYFPAGHQRAGDVWLNANKFDDAKPGTFGAYLVTHEIGHAIGLNHSHSDNGFGPSLPLSEDRMEYTAMAYRSYFKDSKDSVDGNGDDSYPQTFMMHDIRALQHMYGADFTTNSGNTVYKWKPGSGDTLVNGKVAIDAPGSKVFATIWDGGGKDTYDLSAYEVDLKIDLQPGSFSVFAQDQRAVLDVNKGKLAQGSIYNALQYEGDARSLIENAIGGSGDDRITGNDADNVLSGRRGDDTLIGGRGNDILIGGAGDDTFLFRGRNDGHDRIRGFEVDDDVISLVGSPTLKSWFAVSRALVEVGRGVQLRDKDGDVLLIGGVDLDDLSRDNFLFA